MNFMFDGCVNLKTVDLTSFDTSNVTVMDAMFQGCKSLEKVDLSSFNTSNVKEFGFMFSECSKLKEIDLSSFDVSKAESTDCMFQACYGLNTIYVSDKWDASNVTNSYSMFIYCVNLVGGNGTTYDSSITDKTYACIDTEAQKGYLTAK